MAKFKIVSFRGGISDYEDKGIPGAFKMGKNLDIRKTVDSLSAGQALEDEGLLSSRSPSASVSPSSSQSPSASPSATSSPSASTSPSVSSSASQSASSGVSPSPSLSPSASASPSASVSPSFSISLSPSPSAGAGVSTVFEGLIRWFVKGSDGYTYAFDNTGCVYRRNPDAFWQRVYKDTDGAIRGAEEKPSDTGKTWLYFATGTILRRKELPGRSDWNDVETVQTNLRLVDWHTMKQIGGGLKICNGSDLALVGYDDSYTNEAINFIPGNITKTLVERSGKSIAGSYRASDPNKGINAAIDAEIPLAQVGDDGNLIFADMNETVPLTRFPGGGKVNPGGVTNEVEQVNFFEWEDTAIRWLDKQSVGNMALWGVYGAEEGYGGVYSFGRKRKNHPIVLNLEYALDVDEIGAIVTVDGITLISYRDGSTFGVKAVDPDNKAMATYDGLDLRAPEKEAEETTAWQKAELLMKPLPYGTSVEFWYRTDKTGNFRRASVADGSASFTQENGKKAVFLINAAGDIFEPRVVLRPYANTTPEIHRILVFFK